ncbi:hypothetical protein [Elizabethkingia meningoseptica]|uniref:hypothetical protein n=1 Tax=Elizabethkingia meningoseptica TaxID=238 RepID=UPI003892A245
MFRLLLFFSLFILTCSCKDNRHIAKQEKYFVISKYLKERDSLYEVRIKEYETNEDPSLAPPFKTDTAAIGSLNFIIKDKDSAYFYKKALDVNFYMCGNGIEEGIELRKPILDEDLFMKISTKEIPLIINLNKVLFDEYRKKNNRFSPLVVFALLQDSINNDMKEDFTSTLEKNKMQLYSFRKVSRHERMAINSWNSLTSQQQRQLNIQRHNKLYQSN